MRRAWQALANATQDRPKNGQECCISVQVQLENEQRTCCNRNWAHEQGQPDVAECKKSESLDLTVDEV